MKILMLGWELPPYNSGGLGVACYQLCKALSRKGIDIEFLLPYKADHNIDFMKITAAHPQGVKDVVYMSGAYDSYQYVYEDGHTEKVNIYSQQELYEHGVASIVKQRGEEFDIIHAHDWLTFRAALRAKEFAKCPIVMHVHSVERDRAGGQPGNPLVREIEGTALLLADRVIAISQRTKDMIVEDYGIPADKIDVVYNSIDPDDLGTFNGLEAGDKGSGLLGNEYRYLAEIHKHGYRVVVNVGRLTLQKGLPNLLYAAKAVVDKNPKAIFLFVGSGEQYYELIQLAADLGISRNVIFVNFQRGKRWRDSFTVADLFAMPSVSEPFGLTALEAIGYGTPAIISNQSGVAEILKNCLKVEYWDVDEMANMITSVTQNDSLRDELQKNSYREFEKFSWDNSAGQLVDLFERSRQGAAR